MVALHHPSVGLRFAGFDHLAFVVGVVELETVLKNKCEIFIYLFILNDEKWRLNNRSEARSEAAHRSQASWAPPPP